MLTLNKRNTKTWAALLLSGVLLFSMNTTGYAAVQSEPLPKPAWTSPSLMQTQVNTEKDVLVKEINAVPAKTWYTYIPLSL